MKNNEVLAEEVTECDEAALKYLKDIKWCRIDDPKGFKLEFFFDTNPFFKNSVLTKIYHMIDEDEPILEKAIIGTEIEWYPGKCLTQKILKKSLKRDLRIPGLSLKLKPVKVSSTFSVRHKFQMRTRILMKILLRSFRIKWSKIMTLGQLSETKLSPMPCHGSRERLFRETSLRI